ncbi:MAG: hypothetical protein ABIJ56_01725 [Pseudomonadota bacterium]
MKRAITRASTLQSVSCILALLLAGFPANAQAPENTAELCRDEIDNDMDGLIDCDDPDCAELVFCAPAAPSTEPDPAPAVPVPAPKPILDPAPSPPPPAPPPAQKRYTDPFGVEPSGDFELITHISSNSGNEYTDLQIGLHPGVGVFVFKGLQIGARIYISFGYHSHENEDLNTLSWGLGGGAFLRYVFDTRSIVFPFIGTELGGNYNKSEFDSGSDYTQNSVMLREQLGIKIVFAGHGILTIAVSYLFQSIGGEDMFGISIEDRYNYHQIVIGTGLGFWI